MGKKVSGTSNNSSNNTVQQTNVTKNYAMRHPHVSITIITEHNEINLSYNQKMEDSYINKKAYASRDLLSFQVKNALEDDAASFSVVLGGDLRWDRILNADDIMIIRVYENVESPTYNNNYNTNIMTGMITEVRRTGTYSDDQFFYTINGKSMVQAFMQYKIGLVQEVETSLSSMGWLWDTNEEYEADASSSTGQGSNVVSADGVPSSEQAFANLPISNNFGMSESDLIKLAKQSLRVTTTYHMNTSDIKKAISIMRDYKVSPEVFWSREKIEGGPASYSWLDAYSLGNVPSGWEAALKYTLKAMLRTANSSHVTGATAGGLNFGITSEDQKKLDKLKKGTIGHYYVQMTSAASGAYLGKQLGRYGDPFKLSMGIIKQYGGKKGGKGKSSTSSSSGSSTVTSGNTNATSSEISNEEKDSTGVAFLQNNPATIETEIIKRFLPYMRFSWGVKGYGLSHYLDYSGMSCWDEYEHLQYSGNLTNFDGSLYELQQAILAKDQGCPFEEMFYSFEKSGKSHLIVRRTPFNPEDWLTTPTVYIDSDQVISEDVGRDNDEVYSSLNSFNTSKSVLSNCDLHSDT